jgi:adenylate cyclase
MGRGLASFQKYMPTTLVRTLVSRGIEAHPEAHHRVLSVLFTDIVGFTGLTESLGDEIVPVLTEYLELASAAVLGQGGTIDKFIGDAVMAFWGAPTPNDRHAVCACTAALVLQRLLADRNRAAQAAGGVPVAVRIGINTGPMLVGNIGSSERLSYTVIGDSVNVASRIEALNKHYGTAIMIGEETRAAAGDAIIVRRIDRVAVRGRVQGLAIFELLGLASDGEERPGWVTLYENGVDAFAEDRWQAAAKLFQAADEARGGDPPSRLFLERCRPLY